MSMTIQKFIETLGYEDDPLEMDIAIRFYREGVDSEGFDDED